MKNDAIALEPLWSAEQARTYLNISPRSLWSRTRRGEIPCIRIGRCVRYDPADLRAYVERLKRRETSRG